MKIKRLFWNIISFCWAFLNLLIDLLLVIHICFPLQAGISEDQLTLALEPEAASLYCRKVPVTVESTPDGERNIAAMQKGSKYIVFDQGGILF